MRARKIRSVGFSQPRLLPRMLEADGRQADAAQAEGVPTFLLRGPPGGGAGETHSCEAFDWTQPIPPSSPPPRTPASRQEAPQVPASASAARGTRHGRVWLPPGCRDVAQRPGARRGCHRPALRAVRSAEATGELARRRQAHGSGWGPGVPAPETPGHRQPRPRGRTPTVSSVAENVPPSVGKRGLVSRLITRSCLWIRHTRPEACGDKPAPPIEQPHGKRQIHGRR